MGRGFGRGAKSVGIVTHAQVENAKKLPKGLRGSRKKRRSQRRKTEDEQGQLEESMGVQTEQRGTERKKQQRSEDEGGKMSRKTLAQEIAGIQFQHVVNKRQKGFKSLRKQLVNAVKDVRRRYAQKNKARASKQHKQKELAAKYEIAAAKHASRKTSGNTRRTAKEE
jgi:hypothetical protein